MFNARDSLKLLTESDALDGLLDAARKQAAKTAGTTASPVSPSTEITELQEKASELQAAATSAANGLRGELQAKEARKQEKLAVVRHLVEVGSRLYN